MSGRLDNKLLPQDILHQGRLFVTSTAACFYSYIFGWEQKLILDWKDVTTITKEKTAIFIPNAIQITTDNQKFFFASFVDRESSYLMLVKFWQAATSDQWLQDEDIDQIIALNYGEGDEEDEDDGEDSGEADDEDDGEDGSGADDEDDGEGGTTTLEVKSLTSLLKEPV